MKILLVEDDPNIQELISRGLTPLKCEVVGAQDSREGLRLLQNFKPDLIITDHTSPEISSAEFIQKARSMILKRSVPVLLISGMPDQRYWESLKNLSSVARLQKPFTIPQLLQSIETITRPAETEGILLNLEGVVRSFLVVLKTLLPESWYGALCRFAFPIYKKMSPWIYKIEGLTAYLRGDKEGVRMFHRIHAVLPYTFVEIPGLKTTYKLASQLNEKGIRGDFVELGVARGGCSALMAFLAAEAKESRKVWLFDSFEGLPEPTEDDYVAKNGKKETGEHLLPLVKGSCLGSSEQVRWLLFKKFKLPESGIRMVKGWFQDTLPSIKHGGNQWKIAMLRIDGDWYESTKCCLENLYDLVSPGGVVILDDYQRCYGCKKAADEFIQKRNLPVEMMLDGGSGSYFFKPLN